MVIHVPRLRAEYSATAVIISTLLSLAMFAVILGRTNIATSLSHAVLTRPRPFREAARFVEIRERAPLPARRKTAATQHAAPRTRQPPRSLPATGESRERVVGSRDTTGAIATRVQPSLLLAPPAQPPRSYVTFPEPYNPFVSRVMTARERDSLLAANLAMPHSVAYLRALEREIRDSLWRESVQPGTIPGRTAGEQGRAGSGGGGSLSLSLFSAGPSREQRIKDSVAHAINASILARLQERARRKGDSMRLADSMARPRLIP